jgi:hypothetical protein
MFYSPDLDPDPLDNTLNSLQDTQIGLGSSEFQGAGLGVSFTNDLDVDNIGSFGWTITNETGALLRDVRFFAFLDGEIDFDFFNENGAAISVPGAGASDADPDYWEIDEPGFLFGDIFDNLLAGFLDNTNGVPAGSEDDVSLALGFDIGDLAAGAQFSTLFSISETNIGGLRQTDADSGNSFYFNGTIPPESVPAPAPIAMILLSLGLLRLVKRPLLGPRADTTPR